MALTHADVLLASAVADSARPLAGAPSDFDPIVSAIGDARLVLIGEATHGSHDFYRVRAELTRRLIVDEGFTGVVVEADWPDAVRVDRWVRGRGDDASPEQALGDFERFPRWMWRNADVLEFVQWLRAHDDTVPAERRAGFHGLDLYSLHASIAGVLAYLDRVDPEAAGRARERYACFDHAGDDPQRYGRSAALRLAPGCEEEVVAQLVELEQARRAAALAGGLDEVDAQFAAEQDARVVERAEAYYRALFQPRDRTWNLRDTHMADTIDALLAHHERTRGAARLVVWAHNSHVGDARATEAAEEGELNVGQLVRQRHPGDCFLIGATTYRGSVTAASSWDGRAERKRVRHALPESYEALLHATGVPRFLLMMDELGEAARGLIEPRLERAIGVIYRPESERISHYLEATLPRQFDALFHLDETTALAPLDRDAGWEVGELPETFPSGL